MAITNITPLGLPQNEVLGAGKIVANWGLSTQYNLGTTKGGCEFTDGFVSTPREGDADYGMIKDAIDVTEIKPKLTIKGWFKWDVESDKLYAGMSEQTISDGTIKTYRTPCMSNAYSLSNIAWVGRAPSGFDKVIVINDPVCLSEYKATPNKIERIVKEIVWDGTFDPATFDIDDDTTYPFYTETEASVLTITVDDGTDPIEGAVITLSDGQQGTSAVTTGVVPAITVSKGQVKYEIVKTGYTQPTNRVLTIDEDAEAQTISMTAV